MTVPEAPRPDQPFPGAHSQVPGAYDPASSSLDGENARRQGLPLEAAPTRLNGGWVLRLPVRAEAVSIDKQVVVRERVRVSRRRLPDTVHVAESVRREEVRVSTEGDPSVSNQATEA